MRVRVHEVSPSRKCKARFLTSQGAALPLATTMRVHFPTVKRGCGHPTVPPPAPASTQLKGEVQGMI